MFGHGVGMANAIAIIFPLDAENPAGASTNAAGYLIRPSLRFCPVCLCSGMLPARYRQLWEPWAVPIRIRWRYALSRKDDLDNRANQMNPNNDAYWESRGFDGRPDDWEDRIDGEDDQPERSDKESAPRR